jgi:hypothetical protein
MKRYELPDYPGLKRLGRNWGFPNANDIAWENEKSILFIHPLELGGTLYRFNLDNGRLENLFPEFRFMNFQLTSDKKRMAFTGWRKEESSFGKLWLSTNNAPPVAIGESVLGKYDLDYFGWVYDENSIVFSYDCQPKTTCLGVINLQTLELDKIFDTKSTGFPVTNFVSIDSEKIAFDIRADFDRGRFFDLKKQEVIILPFEKDRNRSLRKVVSRNWLAGLISPRDEKGRQIFLATNDFKCVKRPFKDLAGIYEFDVLDTTEDVKFLIRDYSGLLYTLSMKEAIRPQTLDQFFTCPP